MGEMTISSLTITHQEKTLVAIEDLTIQEGLALVGASGSGKSLTLKGLLGMIEAPLSATLTYKASYELVRGKTLSFVPQNPFTALSPLTKIKDQMFSSYDACETMFKRLGLDSSHLELYPNQLSGGQLQRVVLGMALLSRPKLLLLDEPTTALDTTTKHEMITLIRALREEFCFSMLFVTHEIALAPLLCPHMAVMEGGKVVEYGESQKILTSPKSDMAQKLVNSDFTQRKFRQ